jgi:hypothetical protein
MNDFLKMDIFFAVSTLAVIVVALGVGYLVWRAHRILLHIEHVSEQVSRESDLVRADIAELRTDIKKGKGKLKSLTSFIGKFNSRHSSK